MRRRERRELKNAGLLLQCIKNGRARAENKASHAYSSHSNLNFNCFFITFYFNPCVLSIHSDIHHSSTKYIEIEHYSVEYFDRVGACISGKSIHQHI